MYDENQNCEYYNDSILDERIKALSCSTRRKILFVIKEEPKNLRSITLEIDKVYNVIKRHVKIMVACDLIVQTRRGTNFYYQLNEKVLQNVLDSLNSLKDSAMKKIE
ncbi:ArsR/SmtB family transcription factor [Clostridium sporogenes]|uniref:ArsR/SmtB family transcription factor n=1 Tax=Clostridium sporogenes TaxID=1509 RepID=UPI0006B282A3|nr:winged helix-turn-helix transcriptional regulator [Clostridium sporogenes]KOY66127.1 hypothetical protein AN649_09960 [Clostridium sporogenes]MDS1006444.1 winged helix-turn-helix transcriptional regulator [Clostridium sporogenes]